MIVGYGMPSLVLLDPTMILTCLINHHCSASNWEGRVLRCSAMSMEGNTTQVTTLQMAYTHNGLSLLSQYIIHNLKSASCLQNIKKGKGRMLRISSIWSRWSWEYHASLYYPSQHGNRRWERHRVASSWFEWDIKHINFIRSYNLAWT